MNKKTLIIIVVLALIASFLAGSTVARKMGEKKNLSQQNATPTGQPGPTSVPFNPPKSSKPEIKFFVMSFCPYGNQAEAGIEPVYQLLKDKVSFSPRYIVSEVNQQSIDQCKSSCPSQIANENAKTQCQKAIDAGQVTGIDVTACVAKYFPYKTADECIKAQCSILKVGTFDSLHGAQELNQDVREICSLNQGSTDNWWKFINLVNKNCTAQNADTCWTQQAKDSGLDSAKISACEKSQKKTLLQEEIADSTKFKATGSPTVFINGVIYNGGRAPEDYKKAICSAFENPPTECNTVLGQTTATTSGGCAQ